MGNNITLEDLYLLDAIKKRKDRCEDQRVWQFLEAGIIDGYRIHQEFLKDRESYYEEKREVLNSINSYGKA